MGKLSVVNYRKQKEINIQMVSKVIISVMVLKYLYNMVKYFSNIVELK